VIRSPSANPNYCDPGSIDLNIGPVREEAALAADLIVVTRPASVRKSTGNFTSRENSHWM
jgi:hypothetical protein